MALFYKTIQRKNPTNLSAPAKYYAQVVCMGRALTTQEIAERLAQLSSLSEGDVHNVIRNLQTVINQELLNGNSIHLDGFGTFSLRTHSHGEMKEEDVTASSIKRVLIRFTPSKDSKREMTRAQFAGPTALKKLIDEREQQEQEENKKEENKKPQSGEEKKPEGKGEPKDDGKAKEVDPFKEQ